MAESDALDSDPDDEYDPTNEPKSSRAWLAMITNAEKAFRDYQDKADNIEKEYANLERLASVSRDRQFALFWANIAVLGPSVYSRPPVPVVVPRFKDRKPIPRLTSELLERACIVTFALEDIDSVMRLIRDDLSILARGCPWIRYETKDGERVCIDHADRKDFLHDPARTWKEVDWVAKRSWMTKKEMRARFKRYSDKAYQEAAFEHQKDEESGDHDGTLKAGVWELWSKTHNKVVWVTEGVDVLLDHNPPHLKLEGFFPCPRPAYASVQRRSLIPVPDMLFYKDQLEEINELTARISALADAVKVRCFYPAGASDIGDAIEAAVKSTSDNQIMIPVSNWQAFGTGGPADVLVWLPIEMIVKTISELVALRKQLIDDVYQIMGLSDIMRGSTEPSETLGAQELKSQYGSIRIKDKQGELIRIARDITCIVAEIMAENFKSKTLLEMTQMDIPTDADMAKQIKPLEQQIAQMKAEVQKAMADPEIQAMAQQNPEKAQQAIQQVQQQGQQMMEQVGKLKEKPTVEKVMKFLRDERIRPFVLDIETDSTIAPDENAQKQRATEYITSIGGFIQGVVPVIQADPSFGPLAAEQFKWVASQFRVGREMQTKIEEWADSVIARASQPAPPDPAKAKEQADMQAAQMKAQTDAQERQAKAQADGQRAQAESAEKMANAQATQAQAQSKAQDDDLARRIREKEAVDAAQARQADAEAKRSLGQMQVEQLMAKGQADAQEHMQKIELGDLQIRLLQTKISQSEIQTENSIATTEAGIEATAKAAEAKSKQPNGPAP